MPEEHPMKCATLEDIDALAKAGQLDEFHAAFMAGNGDEFLRKFCAPKDEPKEPAEHHEG